MSSGLGFKNTEVEELKDSPRKKTISRGLIVVFVILILIGVLLIGIKMYDSKLQKELLAIDNDIKQVKTEMGSVLSEDTANFVMRSVAFDKELYRNYESNDILGEIEDIMILKTSNGDRTVLKSFQYSAGSKTKKPVATGETTITSSGSVTITADADSFDVMAQQIDAFKKSEMFTNVAIGSTDRDDKGRIIFTLTMDVVNNNESPYEKSIEISTIPVEAPETEDTMTEEYDNETEQVEGNDAEMDMNQEVDAEDGIETEMPAENTVNE